MGCGRARLRHANTSGSQQRLADRAADDYGVEGAFDAAEERGFRGRNRLLLRERGQSVARSNLRSFAPLFRPCLRSKTALFGRYAISQVRVGEADPSFESEAGPT